MSLKRPLLALALSLACVAPAIAAPLPAPKGGDGGVRPQDDFYAFVNGGWEKKTQIPGDKTSYGAFSLLAEQSRKDVRALLEQASKHPADADARLIGDYYASLMDLKAIDRAGLRPLQGELARITSLNDLGDVAEELGEIELAGSSGPVAAYVMPDEKQPLVNAVYWSQSGLGMPDRDYYLKPGKKAEALRKAYEGYLTQLNALAGVPDAAAEARATVQFETALAKVQWSRTEERDPVKTYNPVARADWGRTYPGFPWARFAAGVGMPDKLGAVVGQPSYFKAFTALAARTPLSTWKAYLRSRLLTNFAGDLGPAWRKAHFEFADKQLYGLTDMPPAWRTAVSDTSEMLDEGVGKVYVKQHFTPAAKAEVLSIVHNLIGVYRQHLQTLAWMTPETRKQALDKLAQLRVKVGYPDHWRGYPGLVIKRGDAIGNELRANVFEFQRDMAEAGGPVDRSRWSMSPQTVNAYYNPLGNEIVFPAAILKPPFFDPRRDEAYNYGAIGAVIGHEMSHAYDDEGRHYDGTGKLRDWWQPADAKAFNARAARLVAQYDTYEPIPGEHVNGQLTLGENIADLTGVTMALQAYHRSLDGKPESTVDGYTGDQRFFIGFAEVWRSKTRPAFAHLLLVSDPHSPDLDRVDGVVTNVDGFYDAFGLKPGDKLYKKPADRVHVW
ncbi:MAG TPA: M13 family metallopeptidase [Oscillatoriaceae cyanobacterium]